MNKNFRINTNISNDTILNVNMQQDFDFLEVLTMKLGQKDAYKLHSSNYGVIIGRVLANDAFGIPNAKVSLFIERSSDDVETIESLYPYSEITTKDNEGRRYNLLPDYSDDDCYRIVGTFPNKRLVLDNNSQLEIYDKYWKYTTVTNNAGDYMLFGVPNGNQQIHIDIDLSDIGVLSQKPRDFLYKGYNISMFDSSSQFKESTNLDGLTQLFSQDKSVFVYPFWGDADNDIVAITRCDIQIQYKFEPTCVFMGAIMSDNEGNAIGNACVPGKGTGMNSQLVAGEGTIEMIRKTPDGLIEEYNIQGNQLIDSDGVWCYQIPMNLDFVGTDEYGNDEYSYKNYMGNIIEIRKNKINIKRMYLDDGTFYEKEWNILLPILQENFIYDDRRMLYVKKPYFEKNKKKYIEIIKKIINGTERFLIKFLL